MNNEFTNIPKKIRINYFDYIIKTDAALVEMLGVTKFDDLVIALDISKPKQIIKETLLHEVLHAVLKDTFLFEDEAKAEEQEEKMIRILSPALMNLFRSNPKLLTFLFTKE